mmetsp:Transcript_24745/g.71423  ORF Transcript_24745/g.71423 Transcript_24745/m.71423 type:complete len:80 (-) Transcript_24745:1724-1963(-)
MAPGLLTLFYSNEPPQPDRVREPFIAMEAPRLDADLARDVIQTAIEGDGNLHGRALPAQGCCSDSSTVTWWPSERQKQP